MSVFFPAPFENSKPTIPVQPSSDSAQALQNPGANQAAFDKFAAGNPNLTPDNRNPLSGAPKELATVHGGETAVGRVVGQNPTISRQ